MDNKLLKLLSDGDNIFTQLKQNQLQILAYLADKQLEFDLIGPKFKRISTGKVYEMNKVNDGVKIIDEHGNKYILYSFDIDSIFNLKNEVVVYVNTFLEKIHID